MAEFAYNNIVHASTQQTPFYSNYGHHPRLDMLEPPRSMNPAAEDFATRMTQLQETLKVHLERAQERYKAAADVSEKEHPPFQIGEKVWLLRRNIKTSRPCEKLDYRRLGPFVIQKKINPVASTVWSYLHL